MNGHCCKARSLVLRGALYAFGRSELFAVLTLRGHQPAHSRIRIRTSSVHHLDALSEVRKLNPVGRVPALVLDNGEVLYDSSAILDYLDGVVGPSRALVPAREPDRRQVLRVVAWAIGVREKIVAALYANTMYPSEKQHQPWIVHNESQANQGFVGWVICLRARGWLETGYRKLT